MLQIADSNGLDRHLEERYGIAVGELTELDRGVFRVVRSDGPDWVARVFPPARGLDGAQGDAAILRGLERHRFPAERCADGEPVSMLDGQAVLVTEFVEDHGPLRPGRAAAILGALLGKLHSAQIDGVRAGGAWHHLSFTGGPKAELEAANALLEQSSERVGVRELPLYHELFDEVERTDACGDLPHCFVHPDFVPANAIATANERLVIVDWTGSGHGPRLWSLGFLLWAVGRHPRLVELVASRYRRAVQLEPDELERLAAAIRGRPVMLETWSFCAGRRTLAEAVERIGEVSGRAEQIAALARAHLS